MKAARPFVLTAAGERPNVGTSPGTQCSRIQSFKGCPVSDLVTIFEQDGLVYTVMSHAMPAKDLAKETAKAIRYMPKIPRSQMRIVSIEEFKQMPFEAPKRA